MSRTIDERVVSMQFDNKHFESNVKTSLSTLDKLKRSLNLTGAAKGLDNLTASAKKCDLAPLSSAAETVGLKFNAMYTIADQVFRNITNSAYNAAKNIAKAFTIEPVKTGLQEYETQIGAIQTILANTQSKGSTLDDVNAALDELNTYADKTIYNFTEMTRNIGTFTAAGVDLDKSVTSIKGIANLAAISGSTSQQASTAMYQLSQALASGTVKLMDWNSVVNAGMGGEVFQTALKRTAKQMGYNVDEMIEKYGSFRESLTQGEWLTAEVLTETLTQLSGAYTKADLIAQGYTESQANSILELAATAESAATDVKTFTQLMDTLKESAQSGWTQTWELLIGDFEEAKAMWSKVSDVLGGIIGDSAESRNKVLSGALTSGWDKMIEKLGEAGISADDLDSALRETLKGHDKNPDTLIKQYGSLEKALQAGAFSAGTLQEALRSVVKTETDFKLTKGVTKLQEKGDHVKEIEKALKALGYDLKGKDGKEYGDDGNYGTLTEAAIKDFQKKNNLKVTGLVDDETLAALDKATKKVKTFDLSIDELIDGVTELSGRQKLLESFGNIWEGISKGAKAIGTAWKKAIYGTTDENVITGIKVEKLSALIDGFHKFSEKLVMSKETAGQVERVFKGLFSVVKIFSTLLGGGLSAGFKVLSKVFGVTADNVLEFVASLGDGLVALEKWLFEGNSVAKWAKNFGKGLIDGASKVKDWVDAFIELPEVQKNIEKFKMEFKSIKDVLGEKFSGGLKMFGDFVTRLMTMKPTSLKDVTTTIKNFGKSIWDYFVKTDTGTIFDGLVDSIIGFKDNVKKHLEAAGIKFDETKNKISDFITAVKEGIGKNLGSILALGSLLAFFMLAKKIKDAIELIAKPLDFLDDLGDCLTGIGKAIKTSIKAQAVKSIATSIAILAGSLVALAMLPYGKLWSAVGAIAVMGGVLAGVMFAMSKVSDNLGDLAKLSGTILALSGSLLVFAIAAKVISGIDAGGLGTVALVVGGFVALLVGISKATKKVAVGDIVAFGSMMVSLSGALLLMTVAIGILGNMDAGTLIQGGIAVGAFLLMMTGMMKATKHISVKNLTKFSGMMAGLSASLLIMSLAVGILGNMDAETLLKGGAAIGAFLGMMAGMMAATKLLEKDMPKFGATMLGLSTGLLAMAFTAKIIAGIDGEDLIKGGIVIAAFLTMMAGMMKATQMLTKNSANAGKVGLMILSFAGAMVALTAVIGILSFIEPADLAKATIAIGAIGAIFSGMVALTKYAKVGKGVKTTIIAMAAAVGVLAVSIAALSLVDSTKLAGATGALSAVIGMFALLTASTKFVGTKTLGTLLTLTVIVGALAGLLYLLSDLPSGSAIGVATALSVLVVSLSASCLILAGVGATGPAALIGIGVLAALMAVIAGFAAIAVASLPAIGNQLSKFMDNLEPFLEGAKKITPEIGTGLKNLAEAFLIFTGVGFVNALTFGAPLKTLGNQFKDFGKGLADFSDAISGTNFDGEKVKAAASAAQSLAGVSISLSQGTSFFDWLSGFSGKDTTFSTFGDNLKSFGEGLAGFNSSVTTEDFSVDKIEAAAGAAQTLAGVSVAVSEGTSLMDWLSQWATGENSFSTFGENLKAFGECLAYFNTSVTSEGFNVDRIKAAAEAAQALAGVSVSISEGTSFFDWLSMATTGGKNSFSNFGTNLKIFGLGLKGFNASVTSEGFDVDKIKNAAEAAKALAGVSVTVSEGTSFFDWLSMATTGGQNSFSNFGNNLKSFGEGLAEFNTAIGSGSFDSSKVKLAAEAAQSLAGVSVTLSEGTSFFDWLAGYNGFDTTFSSFSGNLKSFGEGLKAFNTSVTGQGFDAGKVKSAAEAASALAGISVNLSEGSSFLSWISGAGNLDTFGSTLTNFGNGIAGFVGEISGITFGDNVTSAINAAKDLAELGGDIGEDSAGWDWWTGKDNLGDFGNNLKALGGALSAFSGTVSGDTFDIGAVQSAIVEIKKLAGIGSTIGKENYGNLSEFASNIGTLGMELGNFYANISDIDASKLSAVATAIADLASVDVSNASTLQSFVNSLGEVGTSGVDAFVKSFSDATPRVLAAVSAMMSAASMAMGLRGVMLSLSATSVVLNAISAASKASAGFVTAGFQAAQGFAIGISSGSYLSYSAAFNMGAAALRAAKIALGIKSPSREFYAAGVFSVEGFTNAFSDNMRKAYTAGESIAETAKAGLSNAISKVRDFIESDMDTRPTIRPVLDLTDVTNGVGTMNGMFGINPSVNAMARINAVSSMMNGNQNGVNSDIISAIEKLGSRLGNSSGDTYNVQGITYDDGSNVSNAVKALVRAARMERRI